MLDQYVYIPREAVLSQSKTRIPGLGSNQTHVS